MSKMRFTTWLAVLVACTALTHSAFGQVVQPFGPINWDPELDPIDTTEFGPWNNGLNDYNEVKLGEGFFGEYERLNWHMQQPDRRPLGAVNPQPAPLVLGQPFNPFNSIQAASPFQGFGWGNRYTLGYVIDDEGWLVSIIGGYDRDQRLEYGFGPVLDADGNQVFDANGYALTAPDGFNEVVVLFADPFGLISGFIDVSGPNGIADGFDDDIDGDLIFGRDGADSDIPPDGTPDIFAPTDLGDIVTLAPVFDTVTTVQSTKIDSVEVMKLWRHRKPFHENVFVELYAGMRYFKVRDQFDVEATGGILADSFWNTRVQNDIIGPQIGAKYINKRGRWLATAEIRFLAGYNRQDFRQNGILGSQLTTGQGVANQGLPISMGPTAFRNQIHADQFAPLGEIRLGVSYEVTSAISLKIGWTGLFASGIARASNAVVYQVPNMGVTTANNNEDMILNGFNFGLEVNR